MYDLTREEAICIRALSVTFECSWRALAGHAHRLGFRDVVPGNQPHGMDLCEDAAKVLGEPGIYGCVGLDYPARPADWSERDEQVHQWFTTCAPELL